MRAQKGRGAGARTMATGQLDGAEKGVRQPGAGPGLLGGQNISTGQKAQRRVGRLGRATPAPSLTLLAVLRFCELGTGRVSMRVARFWRQGSPAGHVRVHAPVRLGTCSGWGP